MASLTNTIALVTGASRGVGKGIALSLGEAGATVYVTGRTSDQNASMYSGSIEATGVDCDQCCPGEKGTSWRIMASVAQSSM